jgi:hypothetical protein
MMISKDNTVEPRFKQSRARNLLTALTHAALPWGPTIRNLACPAALLETPTHATRDTGAPMATKKDQRIVETATEARQGERGPSVLAMLIASTGLAIVALLALWFVFFRT